MRRAIYNIVAYWTRTAVLATGLTGLTACAVDQAHAQEKKQESTPQKNPQPPLDTPTEKQLEKGRALLEKIAFISANIPLTNAVSVMNFLGFTEFKEFEFPTYKRIYPKGKGTRQATVQELSDTGFLYITADPWAKEPNGLEYAALNATLNTKVACITVHDLYQLLPSDGEVFIKEIVDVHPVARPPRLNNIGNMNYKILQGSKAPKVTIGLTFEYQLCAARFSLSTVTNSQGDK
jgi:hypothetical protein